MSTENIRALIRKVRTHTSEIWGPDSHTGQVIDQAVVTAGTPTASDREVVEVARHLLDLVAPWRTSSLVEAAKRNDVEGQRARDLLDALGELDDAVRFGVDPE